MPVRFSASTHPLHRASSLPANYTFSISIWFRPTVVGASANSFQTMVGFSYQPVSTYVLLQQNSTSAQFMLEASGGASNAISYEANEWVWVGISSTNGGAAKLWYRQPDGGFRKAATNATAPNSTNIDDFGIAHHTFPNSEWFQGDIAHVKVWSAALQDWELMREAYCYKPHRKLNLWGWYPLRWAQNNDHLNDFSGELRTLSGSGAAPASSRDDIFKPEFYRGDDLIVASAAAAAPTVFPERLLLLGVGP